MPIRQYQCPECGHVVEKIEQGQVKRRQIDCPKCEAERAVDALPARVAPAQFNGPGFYRTDYGAKGEA